MNPCTLISMCRRIVITGAFALVLPLPVIAAESLPPETLDVIVLPDRYVAAGKPFTDLAALEAWARPIVLRSVWVDFCYSPTTPQLVAVVERLYSKYSSSVQIRTLPPDEGECAAAAGSATTTGAGERLTLAGANYLAVDAFGRGKLP
jgi:hypothetical protein